MDLANELAHMRPRITLLCWPDCHSIIAGRISKSNLGMFALSITTDYKYITTPSITWWNICCLYIKDGSPLIIPLLAIF